MCKQQGFRRICHVSVCLAAVSPVAGNGRIPACLPGGCVGFRSLSRYYYLVFLLKQGGIGRGDAKRDMSGRTDTDPMSRSRRLLDPSGSFRSPTGKLRAFSDGVPSKYPRQTLLTTGVSFTLGERSGLLHGCARVQSVVGAACTTLLENAADLRWPESRSAGLDQAGDASCYCGGGGGVAESPLVTAVSCYLISRSRNWSRNEVPSVFMTGSGERQA